MPEIFHMRRVSDVAVYRQKCESLNLMDIAILESGESLEQLIFLITEAQVMANLTLSGS